MAPDKHKQPLRTGGELSPSSPSKDLVLSSDRPTRLENALQAFHDVLTDDERKRLRAEMDVSCDAGQVIAFTAGLDVVDPNRRGRSIATRLHSILETVQRFSEVVGIYVSSHPEIAALVWGSVRLAFTVLANFTSFFQTFSELLNGFDTLLPQFKEYQVLFPDSLPLRNSVYNFHAALVSCCTQVISSTRRTWSQQAWASFSSSFESEIRPRVAEIREKAELVKSQAALAKAQDDKKQRKWNSLLLRLSSYDYSSAFNHARGKMHRGTAEWIFSTAEFQEWRESAGSSVLNVSGKIGSGKTILAANAASHLLQTLPQTCSVSYLFVRFDDEKSRVADAILRSLMFQALTGHKVENSLIALLEESASHGFERGSLLSLLGHFVSLIEKTFLIVDGLDQCASQEQHCLLQAFSQLTQACTGHGGVKILISARDSIANEVDRVLAPTKRLRIGLVDTNADLARYAKEILAEKRETGKLVIGDDTIMNQIEDKLRTGGEGMFLWVFLTIEDICSCPTDHDIRQTLKILPRKLSDTFNRALRRILSSQSPTIADLVQRTFRWVTTVRRPLTRWELGEALGVKVLQKFSIKDQIINGTERLPGWCENLVQIEPEDETIRFFHHSIKTHLLGMEPDSTELGAFHIDLKSWDHEVGEICLTYLNFSDFQAALIEPSPDTNSLQIRQIATFNAGRGIPPAVRNQATLHAINHTGQRSAARFLRRFLKPKPKTSGERFNLPKKTPKAGDDLDFSKFFSAYPFLLYASTFWLHHTFHFLQSTTKTWNLWKDQVESAILEDGKFWVNFGQQPPGFEKFDSESWLADEINLHAETSMISVSDRSKSNAEHISLHRAIIFADFIAHRTLLAHVLTTIHSRGLSLSPHILASLLQTRRVFQLPFEREGYTQDENSHDGVISLILEFIAWGGHMWPKMPSLDFGYNMYGGLAFTISRGGYSQDVNPWFQLFAKIAILKLTKETFDAIESWTMSDEPCIHKNEYEDIVRFIFKIGGSSSLKFARSVLDLHENCVGGHKYTVDDWRRRLRDTGFGIRNDRTELYLQGSEAALAEQKLDCGIDDDLLRHILRSGEISLETRSRAISIAIPEVKGKRSERYTYYTLENAVISEVWDVAVALSRRGEKLAGRVLYAGEDRSCAQVFDDILCCASQSSRPRCEQGALEAAYRIIPTLRICAHHFPNAVEVWKKSQFSSDNKIGPIALAIHKLLKDSGWGLNEVPLPVLFCD